jgi:hypothetical protein
VIFDHTAKLLRLNEDKLAPCALIDSHSSADARQLLRNGDGRAILRLLIDAKGKTHFGEWKAIDVEATGAKLYEFMWQDTSFSFATSILSLTAGVKECPSFLGYETTPGHRVVRVSWISNVPMRLRRVPSKLAFSRIPEFNWVAFQRCFEHPTALSLAAILFWEAPIGAFMPPRADN